MEAHAVAQSLLSVRGLSFFSSASVVFLTLRVSGSLDGGRPADWSATSILSEQPNADIPVRATGGRVDTGLLGREHEGRPVATLGDLPRFGPPRAVGVVEPAKLDGAVFEVAGQRTAYVLIDGNNMEPGLRDAIVVELDGVDNAEVMTTDTHIVNTVEAENQVGQAIPDDELIALIADLTDRAVDDLEPVEAGMASEKARVTVFGNDRTETLASTANAVVSLGGALAVTFILTVLTVSIGIFLLTGG